MTGAIPYKKTGRRRTWARRWTDDIRGGMGLEACRSLRFVQQGRALEVPSTLL
jgi:hypothetical protein